MSAETALPPEADAAKDDSEDYLLSREELNELQSYVAAQDYVRVRAMLSDWLSGDIAELLNMLGSDLRSQLLQGVPDCVTPQVLPQLHAETLSSLLPVLGAVGFASLVSRLESDDAVRVLDSLQEEEKQAVLNAMPVFKRQDLQEGLAYAEDSAGRLMQRRVVSIPESWTVGNTIDYLRANQSLPDDFYEMIVVNPAHAPTGLLLLSRVMRSRREVPVSAIMDRDFQTLTTHMDQEEVAYIFRKYALAGAPVVAEDGSLLGAVFLDDILAVMQQEDEEDILRLGGVTKSDVRATMAQTVRKRFPWLFINLITAIIASLVIARFQGEIDQLVALAVLMPIIASMGGNAGTQTMTVAVRALATRELHQKNSLLLLGKELLVGGVNGLLFALVSGLVAFLWFGEPQLALVFALATVFTLLFSGFSGTLVPIVLSRIGLDPAVASGVFLTTITDVLGYLSFLGLAAMMLM